MAPTTVSQSSASRESTSLDRPSSSQSEAISVPTPPFIRRRQGKRRIESISDTYSGQSSPAYSPASSPETKRRTPLHNSHPAGFSDTYGSVWTSKEDARPAVTPSHTEKSCDCTMTITFKGHIDESTQCFIPRKYITHQVTSPAQELDSHCGLSEGFLRLFSTAGLLEATQTESGEASPRPVSHGYKEKPLPPIPTSTNTWPKSVSGLSLAKGKSQHFSDSAVPATDEQSSVTLDAKVRSQSCSGRQDLRQGLSSSTNNLCKRNEKHLSPQARARSSALSASALRFSDTIHPLALADMSSASAANQASAGDEEEEEDPFTSSDEISPYAQTGARVFLPAKNEAPVVPSTNDYLEIEDLAPNHAEFLPRLRSTGFFVTGNGDESPKPPPRSHLQDIAPSRRTPADSATPPPVPKKKKKDKMQENSATLQSTSNSSKIYEHLV